MNRHLLMKTAAAATAIALVLCGCFSGSPAETHSPPAITIQPADILAAPGQNISFETAAAGEGITYQWYYKKYNFPRWLIWKGHTSSRTYATVNSTWNGMRVYCCIRDKYGSSIATRSALVSLGDPPVITSQPCSVTVNLGETAYFRVSATGNGELQYQWYYKKRNSTFWTKWRGHTLSETEAVSNNSWNGMQVFCIVTDSTGGSTSSLPATVTITDIPTIISQPESATLSKDGSAAFSVKGGTEGLDYQWYFVPQGSLFGVKMLNRDQAELSLTSADVPSGKVYCRVNCPGGSAIISDRAAIQPAGTPLLTLHPQSVAARSGETMSFSAEASGDGLKYRWFLKRKNLSVWSTLKGQTASDLTLTVSPALSGSEICCEVTDSSGNSILSQPAEITVNDKIDIAVQPKDATVSSGEEVRLRIVTGAREARFQWYADRGDGFGWVRLPGQTGSEFVGIADSRWHGWKLKCVITADGCTPVSSRAATVTVNDLLTLKKSPDAVSARSGDEVKFSVKATGRDLRYQWMRMDKGTDTWRIWKGQNNPTVLLAAERSWHRMKVRCDISDRTGKIISSDSANVWIKDALDILRHPGSIAVTAYEPAEFSVVAQGDGLRYQWYYKKKGMHDWHIWKNHTTAVTSALSNPSWDGMRVKCVVTDAHGSRIASNASAVTIKLP